MYTGPCKPTVNGKSLRFVRTHWTPMVKDDIFVYFRTSPPPPDRAAGHERVQSFRKKLHDARRVFSWDYETVDELRDCVHKHLRNWLDRWQVVPDICVNTLAPGSTLNVQATNSTEFRNASGQSVDAATFFAALTNGATLEVEGSWDGAVFHAVKAHFDDNGGGGDDGPGHG